MKARRADRIDDRPIERSADQPDRMTVVRRGAGERRTHHSGADNGDDAHENLLAAGFVCHARAENRFRPSMLNIESRRTFFHPLPLPIPKFFCK